MNKKLFFFFFFRFVFFVHKNKSGWFYVLGLALMAFGCILGAILFEPGADNFMRIYGVTVGSFFFF